MYLLDTNAVSEFVSSIDGPVARKVARVGHGNLIISPVVLGEIEYGLAKRPDSTVAQDAGRIARTISTPPLGDETTAVYGSLRRKYEASGQSIDANDLWIASQAIALGAVLVSADKVFERVEEVTLENWALGASGE